jgi:regulator of sirC expression with transglutaminase-like and TPR domain
MDQINFEDEVNKSPIFVPRAALSFARNIAYPDLDLDAYEKRLADLVGIARQKIPGDVSVRERAARLAEALFHQMGFRGDRAHYADPRNSFLNDVLDRRLGIPISLSVIFVFVAQKLGIPAEGVGMPGHFIVRVKDSAGDLFLDPFDGGTPLSKEDCGRLVKETTGYQGAFQDRWLAATPPKEILVRMLNNLKGVYVQADAWESAIKAIEHLKILQPDSPLHSRDLGFLYYRQGSLLHSIKYLDTYLRSEPHAKDAGAVRHCLQFVARELARLN